MEFFKYLDKRLNDYIKNHPQYNNITEIRLRAGTAVNITVNGKNEVIRDISVSSQQLENIFYNMCQKSQNIYEDEISEGYITLKDGHRIGIGGEYFYNKNTGKNVLKQLVSLNIRISKDILCFENQQQLFSLEPESTLVVGLPHSGKTSLLRLYAEKLSHNNRVVICDERKELRTDKISCDVVTGINKASAISIATRTLNPQFIVCDEIGAKKEAEEILSAVNTGVKLVCSAHGKNSDQVKKRPHIKRLIDEGVFYRIVTLRQTDDKFYIGAIEDV